MCAHCTHTVTRGEFTDNALSTKVKHCLSSHSPNKHAQPRKTVQGNIISVIPTRILHKLNQFYRYVCPNAKKEKLTSLHKKLTSLPLKNSVTHFSSTNRRGKIQVPHLAVTPPNHSSCVPIAHLRRTSIGILNSSAPSAKHIRKSSLEGPSAMLLIVGTRQK